MITVERIHTEHGSHVEPPLNERWSKQQKLEWQAAVVAHDTGLRVEIRPGRVTIAGFPLPDQFTVIVGYSSTVLGYHEAWTYLSGVDIGARSARALGLEET